MLRRGGGPQGALAPAWHTAALVVLIVAVAAAGTALTRGGVVLQPSSRVVGYVQAIVVAWGLLVYVYWFARSPAAMRAVLGTGWGTLRQALADLALAAAGWLTIELCELSWNRLSSTAIPTSVSVMLPHGPVECGVWAVLSFSVGLSEEVVFRGYLRTQLAVFTAHPRVGNLLQAMLFGVAHADQGMGAVVRLAAYGLGLGALARWRRSLLPGVVCHIWTNLASGLLHP